jgi:hypothetical protein
MAPTRQSGYGAVSANRYLERGRRTPRCPSRDRECLPQRVQWRRRRRGRAVGPLGSLGSPPRYTSRRFRVYCRPARGSGTTGDVCRRCGELARCGRPAVRAKLLLLQVITPICVAIRMLTGGIPLDSCEITQIDHAGIRSFIRSVCLGDLTGSHRVAVAHLFWPGDHRGSSGPKSLGRVSVTIGSRRATRRVLAR